MTDVDVAKLSYAELIALRKSLDREIADKRGEELKVLADGYAKKAQAAGFTVAEAIQALQPYVVAKPGGKPSGEGAPVRILYRDPANPDNTWSGRGRAARWLADYEAAGRSRDEFKLSGS